MNQQQESSYVENEKSKFDAANIKIQSPESILSNKIDEEIDDMDFEEIPVNSRLNRPNVSYSKSC